MTLLKVPCSGISDVQLTTGPYHRAWSVVCAVHDTKIVHGVYLTYTS